MFEPFGNINVFKFFKRPDKFTYSYITYETIDEADKAIKALNKKQIQDKVLKVDFAAPYTP
jgi:RNA recognition motif-containing protein